MTWVRRRQRAAQFARLLHPHDLDLAELCQWTVDTHYPDPKNENRCVACGERWLQDVNIGAIQCQAVLDARIQNNLWVMRKVWKIREKWKAHL